MNITDIKIGERHRNDLGDISLLAKSIEIQGLLQPIGVTADNVLVFGERRLTACRDILGWTDIDARIVDVTSIVEGEHDENELRKDFTPSERVAIARAVEHQLGNRQGQRTELMENIPEVSGKTTRSVAAEKAGFGNETTYRQAKAVVETGVPELVEKMDAGTVSVSGAALIAKQDKEIQNKIVAEDNLKKAVSELREAEKRAKEAEALPKAVPLTPEQKADQEEVFGTVESRSVFMDVLRISEMVASFPDATVAMQKTPPALEHAIDIDAFREVSRWFDAFCNAYQDKDNADVAA